MINFIRHQEELLAIIIRSSYSAKGIKFFTPDEFSQQLAYMNHPAAYSIPPHLHNPIPRSVTYTREVLFVKSGEMRVDFYSESAKYLKSAILTSGDVILLASGGHGFEMLEATELIEVKQGPYAGENDKTRFEAISADKIIIE